MRIAIIGSRPSPTTPAGKEIAIETFIRMLPPATVIISGGAPGVDTWAENAALKYGLVVARCIPPWVNGKRAAFQRNDLIVDLADKIVAFWDGHSAGTSYVIDRAATMNKPVVIVYDNEL